MPKRILLFSLNFDPEPTGSAPYMTRLARHLAREHALTVITGHPHYPSWRVRTIASDRVSNPRVIRYRHFVPRRPSMSGRALYEISWLSSASRGLLAGPRYDLVISAIPTLSAGLLALLAGRRHRAPVGLIFHDLVGPGAGQSGVAPSRAASSLERAELAIARRASEVAVLCEDFRPYLQSHGVPEDRILRFRNWGRLGLAGAGVEETRRRLGWGPSDFVCLHAGNMGRKQGLESVVEAACLLPERGIKLVLAGDGNDRSNLAALAHRLKLENLDFLPVQPPGEYESMLAAADVLILNQRPSVREMSIPSKLSAYFRAGRPILAAIDAKSAAARELAQARAGRVIPPGEPARLARSVLALKSLPEMRRRLGENGHRYAESTLRDDADLVDYDNFVARLLRRSYRSRHNLAAAQ